MTFTEREAVYPQQFVVDPNKPDLAIFTDLNKGIYGAPNSAIAFSKLNVLWKHDPVGRLQFMADSVLRPEHLGVDLSYMQDGRDERSRDLLVVMSPLNDGRPVSSVEKLYNFIKDPQHADKNGAMPNSWSPITKLYIDYEYGHAENMGMPRLQVFARETPALTTDERKAIASGDTRPYGRLALEAIAEASRIRHETFGDGGFDRIHFFCAGMGSKALGAAVHMIETSDQYELGSITLQNLAIGDDTAVGLLSKYAGRKASGDAAKIILPPGYTRVPEPQMRLDIDGHGAELAMRKRQIQAMKNWRVVRGIMTSDQVPHYIEQVMEHGMVVTVANAFNEAMVAQSESHLPRGDRQFHYMQIVGIEGKKVKQMVNEQSAVIAKVSNQGIAHYHDYKLAA